MVFLDKSVTGFWHFKTWCCLNPCSSPLVFSCINLSYSFSMSPQQRSITSLALQEIHEMWDHIFVTLRHRMHIPRTKELHSTRIIKFALQFANKEMELAGLAEHRLDKLVQFFFLGMVLNDEKLDSSIRLLFQPCLFQLPVHHPAHPSWESQ